MPLRFPLIFLVACASCESCQPKVSVTPPAGEGETGRVDTADTADTAGGGGPVDTSPPPPCDQPEIEPNGSLDEATEIALELTACGTFEAGDAAADLDYYAFEVPEGTDWIKADVDAVSRGSFADVTMYLNSEDNDFMLIERDTDSNDPRVIFPVPEGTRDWEMLLVELNSGSGPDYFYEVMISATKPPVKWTDVEVEPNDTFDEGMTITEDMMVFGSMDSQSDLDQYNFQPPPGDNVITFHVTALTAGSAMASRLVYSRPVYGDPDTGDGVDEEVVLEYEKVQTATGAAAATPDAIMEVRSDGSEPIYLTVRELNSASGPAHWYVLSIDAIEPYVEPADTADTGGATP